MSGVYVLSPMSHVPSVCYLCANPPLNVSGIFLPTSDISPLFPLLSAVTTYLGAEMCGPHGTVCHSQLVLEHPHVREDAPAFLHSPSRLLNNAFVIVLSPYTADVQRLHLNLSLNCLVYSSDKLCLSVKYSF